MSNAARTTIDTSGRLVVPKAIREKAHLHPGMELEIRYFEGRVEIEPAPRSVRVIDQGGVAVAVPFEPSQPLTAAQVRATLEDLRRRAED